MSFDPSQPIFMEFPPPKTLQHRECLVSLNNQNKDEFITIPIGSDTFKVHHFDDSWGEFDISFYGPELEIPNPHYDDQMKLYESRKAAFDKKLAQWKLDKERYDREKAKKDELAEKVLYQKLKRKFEAVPDCPNCSGQREESGKPGLYNCHFCGLLGSP